jgi:hypothetical protein
MDCGAIDMKKIVLGTVLAVALSLPASAQQQQQISPYQLSHQIDDAVFGMAARIDQLEKELAEVRERAAHREEKREERQDRPAEK